jgi:hypothetical protein
MIDAYEAWGHRWEVVPYAGPTAVCTVKHGHQVCNALVTHACVEVLLGGPSRQWRRCDACAAEWYLRHIGLPRAQRGG